jgi:hypothetical protein
VSSTLNTGTSPTVPALLYYHRHALAFSVQFCLAWLTDCTRTHARLITSGWGYSWSALKESVNFWSSELVPWSFCVSVQSNIKHTMRQEKGREEWWTLQQCTLSLKSLCRAAIGRTTAGVTWRTGAAPETCHVPLRQTPCLFRHRSISRRSSSAGARDTITTNRARPHDSRILCARNSYIIYSLIHIKCHCCTKSAIKWSICFHRVLYMLWLLKLSGIHWNSTYNVVLYFEDVFIECFTCFHYVISSTNFELEATKRN